MKHAVLALALLVLPGIAQADDAKTRAANARLAQQEAQAARQAKAAQAQMDQRLRAIERANATQKAQADQRLKALEKSIAAKAKQDAAARTAAAAKKEPYVQLKNGAIIPQKMMPPGEKGYRYLGLR